MEVEKATDSGVTPLSVASENESVGSGHLHSGSKGVKRKRAADTERKPLVMKSVNPGVMTTTSLVANQGSGSARSRTSSRGSSPGRSASAPPREMADLKEEVALKGIPANALGSCLPNNEQCKSLMAMAKKRRIDGPARSVELACGRKLKDFAKFNPIPAMKEDAIQTHISFPLSE